MGSAGKSDSLVDRRFYQVLGTWAALETVAIAYLGFPVVTPAIVATGVSYGAYKVGKIAIVEFKAVREEKKQKRIRDSQSKDLSSKLD